MGKSPGKWIKGVLFGKKSTKSSLSKGREVLKTSNEGEPLTSSKVAVDSVPETTGDSSLTSQLDARINASYVVDSESVVAANFSNDEVFLASSEANGAQTVATTSPEEVAEKLTLEKAVVKAQTAFRGYQARCSFRTLKGIIRLQALVRGHLVRRQAVVTFHCVRGIVKLQALARGRKVRCSDIGTEVQKSCNVAKLPGANSSGTNASNCMETLSSNTFIYKLLASSSSTALPRHIQYNSGEPNSDSEWLDRWTRLQLPARPKSDRSKPKKQAVVKSKAKSGGFQTKVTQNGRSNRSVRLPSPENGLSRSSDFEKPKRNLRKVYRHLADSVPEHSQNGNENVKGGETPPEETVKELGSKDESVINGTHKTSQGRSSLPGKIDQPENGAAQGTPNYKVPSYMAPTESVKAKLRAQGSPRLVGDDVIEKNEMTRRHSLPSATNVKLITSMSPRVPKLVQAAGKGSIRTDRSLSSSRDGFERAEWKR